MAKLYRYKKCIVCGNENPIGFNIEFKEKDGCVYGKVNPGQHFEGYSEVIHGGILSTLLDEVMVKALFSIDIIAVTMEITVKFRKPAATGQELTIRGYPGEVKSKTARARGEVLIEDGSIAADADGIFYILKGDRRERMLATIE
jgi:uncharacterized protein (TIGR00369 family)